jgi:hypothetical protein
MKINLIQKNWERLETMEVEYLPRQGELIYSHTLNKYLVVFNVVHHTYMRKGIFLKYPETVVSIIVEDIKPQ